MTFATVSGRAQSGPFLATAAVMGVSTKPGLIGDPSVTMSTIILRATYAARTARNKGGSSRPRAKESRSSSGHPRDQPAVLP